MAVIHPSIFQVMKRFPDRRQGIASCKQETSMKTICLYIVLASSLASMLFINSGCMPYATPGERGAVHGAAMGAVAGQAIGRNTKSTLIGAGAGALGGAVINNERARRKGCGYYDLLIFSSNIIREDNNALFSSRTINASDAP